MPRRHPARKNADDLDVVVSKFLIERLREPDKNGKFKETDIDERAVWDDYQSAYSIAVTRCSTEWAPWFVVPADHKWYRNWAITRLLLETLRGLDPQWPVRPELDLPGMIARLQESPPTTRARSRAPMG